MHTRQLLLIELLDNIFATVKESLTGNTEVCGLVVGSCVPSSKNFLIFHSEADERKHPAWMQGGLASPPLMANFHGAVPEVFVERSIMFTTVWIPLLVESTLFGVAIIQLFKSENNEEIHALKSHLQEKVASTVRKIILHGSSYLQTQSRNQLFHLTKAIPLCEIKKLIELELSEKKSGAVLFISLDHFDLFNDSLGGAEAREIFELITDIILLTNDTQVAKVSEKSFVVFVMAVPHDRVEVEARSISRKIASVVEYYTSCKISGCNIGISYIGANDESYASGDVYISQAESACAQARLGASQSIVSFDRQRQRYSQEVVKALKDKRVQYAYQPIVRVHDRTPAHYEALIRLRDSAGNIVEPNNYLSYIESTSIMLAVDKQTVDSVLDTIRGQGRQGKGLVKVALNVSGRSLQGSEWVDYLHSRLEDSGVNPNQIIVEITETWTQVGASSIVPIANEIVSIGCSVALDDFGAGNHSYEDLLEIPAQYIKLDSSLISQIVTSRVHRNIVKHLTYTAEELGKLVIAEAVSSKEILSAVADVGIPLVQGFYVGRPTMSIQEAARVEENHRTQDILLPSGIQVEFIH
jgi:EAL domain-containing protein (putative c-di-GMP-specific phosphodiesterase class I)/GGDEF domain-containing protein